MPTNLTGQTLANRYRLEALIGEGGFATVYRATQLDLGRSVAVKVLDERLASRPQFIERFRREAEATFSLRHPNIIEVYDFQGADGTYFMVMEYVEGPTLRQVLQKQGAFSGHDEEEVTRLHEQSSDESEATLLRRATRHYQPVDPGMVVKIAADLCGALEYAHAQGIVHRDLKPDNVLIAPPGQAKLGDFGIARVQEDTRLTRTGLRIGTMAYMSPEQILGSKTIDARSDLYSLGIMLYELLAGTVPFIGNDMELMRLHLGEDPLPLSTLREGLPAGLERAALRLLAKKPEERFPSAAEARQALLKAAAPASISALVDQRPTPPGEETRREQDARLVCPVCSAALDGTGQPCSLCGDPGTPETRAAAAASQQAEAESLVAGMKLRPGLSMDVRAYEYERTIEPELESRHAAALQDWQRILSAGAVVTPTSRAEDRMAAQSGTMERLDARAVVKVLNQVNSLAALWASPAVAQFSVSLQARRAVRARAALLRRRALMLAGLLWSLRGQMGKDPGEMQGAYEQSRALWQQAAGACGEEEPELAAACALAERTAAAILLYPQDIEAASRELQAIADALQASTAPWAKTDRKRLVAQARLREQIESTYPKDFLNKLEQELQTVEKESDELVRQMYQAGLLIQQRSELEARRLELEKQIKQFDRDITLAASQKARKSAEFDQELASLTQKSQLGSSAYTALRPTLQAAMLHQPLPEGLNTPESVKAYLAALRQVIEQAKAETTQQLKTPTPPQPRPARPVPLVSAPEQAAAPAAQPLQKSPLPAFTFSGEWKPVTVEFADDRLVLDASITIRNGQPLRNAAMRKIQEILTKQEYFTNLESTEDELITMRGSALERIFTADVRKHPTSLNISASTVPTGYDLKITIQGRVQVKKIAALTNADLLNKELAEIMHGLADLVKENAGKLSQAKTPGRLSYTFSGKWTPTDRMQFDEDIQLTAALEIYGVGSDSNMASSVKYYAGGLLEEQGYTLIPESKYEDVPMWGRGTSLFTIFSTDVRKRPANFGIGFEIKKNENVLRVQLSGVIAAKGSTIDNAPTLNEELRKLVAGLEKALKLTRAA